MLASGTFPFAASPDRVWAVLMDTAAIAACVPGCTELVPLGEDRYRARMSVVIAAVSGDFDATIALTDKSEPHAYTLHVDGQGRAGFVKGTAKVQLTPVAEQTRVDVTADVQVGGPVARVGQRLLEGVGKMMMERFFACLGSKL